MALVGARRRRALIVALAVTLVATLTAGSCRPNSSAEPQQTPGDDVSYEELPPAPAGSEDPHDRQNVLPVPKGTSPRGVEFADANTGYALFSSCVAGQACQVGLAITLDGGASWVSRKLPFDDATDVDMRLGRGNVLIVKAAPDGYFVSRDAGRTFQLRPLTPPPAELALADPQFSVGCQDPAATDCEPQPWTVGDDGTRSPLPGHPPGTHRYTGLAAATDGTLWLTAQAAEPAGTPGGAVITVWSSADHGRTWQPQGTARAADATVLVRPVVAPDGSDVWLVGSRFAARRVLAGGAVTWVEATAMREVTELLGAEVLPGGVVLVASSQGVWLLDQQHRVRDPGARLVFRLRRLDDGTILGYPAQQSGEVWLCTVQNQRCDWAHVAVSAR